MEVIKYKKEWKDWRSWIKENVDTNLQIRSAILYNDLYMNCPNVTPPMVTKNEDGSLSFEWNTKKEYLEILLLPKSGIEYFYRNVKEKFTICSKEKYIDNIPKKILDLLNGLVEKN